MKNSDAQPCSKFLYIFFAILLFSFSAVNAADGKKWDGKAYPFQALDASQPNSERNPFIINTAGKLAYIYKLAKMKSLEDFGEINGLKGLKDFFKDNYVKLTADLDMNGSLYEFITIPDTWINFDGGGHVINNMRISDNTTKPVYDDMARTWKIYLALFQYAEQIKNVGIGKGSTVSYISDGYLFKNKKYLVQVYAASIAIDAHIMDGCFSYATITVKGNGEVNVGGLAARCGYKLSNSYFSGAIIVEGNIINARDKNTTGVERPGDLQVAGVCGEPAAAFETGLKHAGIFNCYNTAPITVRASGKEMQIGGVAARLGKQCECRDIYNTGNLIVSATGDIKLAFIGGVAGTGIPAAGLNTRPIQYFDTDQIYNKGNINVTLHTGTKICVGGVGGGEVEDKLYFDKSSYPFGGIYGFKNTCNMGSISVSSTEKVEDLTIGGIAGYGYMVFNSYNSGNISCNPGTGTNLYAGGIGGKSVYAQDCYNIGALSSKGTGVNVVGGVIGLADMLWGEDDNHWFSVMNVYWLKQPQANGINSNITYGKGSYFYKKEGGKMVEDYHAGAIYFFEDAFATAMARSDDDPRKRKAYQGTLLQALNEAAEKWSNRKYRKFKIDGSNGGYPVFQ